MSTSGVVNTTVLDTKISEVENKTSDTSILVTTTVNTKIIKVHYKIPNQEKCIAAPEFNKLTAEVFAARLEQASLVSKTNFNNKLTSSNRTIYLEVQ